MSEREWRYLPRGTRAHTFLSTSPSDRGTAVCGTSPQWFDPHGWHGTGTQNEYERAARLPKCKRCLRILGLPALDPTPAAVTP
jgi:hypothetical protein